MPYSDVDKYETLYWKSRRLRLKEAGVVKFEILPVDRNAVRRSFRCKVRRVK